jgi:(p)ppGpp synthase/HD superfamily hydrolase
MLREWIEDKYFGRQIRISGEPYFTHLVFVAEMAAKTVSFGYETGLCHDLLEDTGMPATEFYNTLLKFRYPENEARYITETVVELTDVFTKEAYPGMSKKERKKKEAKRLLNISSAAQTVKYADLMYNINWTLKYEPRQAKKYLKKKKKLIDELTGGDPNMYRMVTEAISNGLSTLKNPRAI